MNGITIRGLPILSALLEPEIQYLLHTLTQSEHPANTLLFNENDIEDTFSIILEGEVELIHGYGSPDGHTLVVRRPGDYLGEMALLDEDRRRATSALTRTRVTLLSLSRAHFDNLLEHKPRAAAEILRNVVDRKHTLENTLHLNLDGHSRQLAQTDQELRRAQEKILRHEQLTLEHTTAQSIRDILLPKSIPVVPGWRLNAHWQPALDICGDLYDFIQLPDNQLGIILAEVAGSGIPAALMMATTRSMLRTAAWQFNSPGDLLAYVNEILKPEMSRNLFVTCFYIMLDPVNGMAKFANAGEPAPLLLSESQDEILRVVKEVRATGIPLGQTEDISYEEEEIELQPGESILLYSSGLIDMTNSTREIFGLPRLQSLLENLPANHDIIASVTNQVNQFLGDGQEPEDDITLISIERTEAVDYSDIIPIDYMI
jgi:serine phosphatase RsbU (regulator of sigma subunit)